jgi:hypothetical protein
MSSVVFARQRSEKTPVSHIFISYSHLPPDKEYARRLADELKQRGFEVWIDDRIDYGTSWPRVIQDNLDASAAVIVILTPRAWASDWVQSELARAKRKHIPLYPLLLEGDYWLAVESTQTVDVRTGALPPEGFYGGLALKVLGHTTAPQPQAPIEPPQPKPPTGPSGLRFDGLYHSTGGEGVEVLAFHPDGRARVYRLPSSEESWDRLYFPSTDVQEARYELKGRYIEVLVEEIPTELHWLEGNDVQGLKLAGIVKPDSLVLDLELLWAEPPDGRPTLMNIELIGDQDAATRNVVFVFEEWPEVADLWL